MYVYLQVYVYLCCDKDCVPRSWRKRAAASRVWVPPQRRAWRRSALPDAWIAWIAGAAGADGWPGTKMADVRGNNIYIDISTCIYLYNYIYIMCINAKYEWNKVNKY